jgi:hypothetical protein
MADGTDESEAIKLARSGISSAMGKCTEPLKTSVPQVVEAKFKTMAAEAGCTTAELLRDLICLRTHGETFGELSATLRRSVLDGQGRELGLLRVVAPSGDVGHREAA